MKALRPARHQRQLRPLWRGRHGGRLCGQHARRGAAAPATLGGRGGLCAQRLRPRHCVRWDRHCQILGREPGPRAVGLPGRPGRCSPGGDLPILWESAAAGMLPLLKDLPPVQQAALQPVQATTILPSARVALAAQPSKPLEEVAAIVRATAAEILGQELAGEGRFSQVSWKDFAHKSSLKLSQAAHPHRATLTPFQRWSCQTTSAEPLASNCQVFMSTCASWNLQSSPLSNVNDESDPQAPWSLTTPLSAALPSTFTPSLHPSPRHLQSFSRACQCLPTQPCRPSRSMYPLPRVCLAMASNWHCRQRTILLPACRMPAGTWRAPTRVENR